MAVWTKALPPTSSCLSLLRAHPHASLVYLKALLLPARYQSLLACHRVANDFG